MPATPEEYHAWIGITRDFVLVGIGSFMLIFETVFVAIPNPFVIGAGLTALGLPAAIRLNMTTSAKKADGES